MGFWHSIFIYVLLLAGMVGNQILPYCWGKAWRDHDLLRIDTIMLGDPDSPVRWVQRLWRLVLGSIFILGGIMMYWNFDSYIWINGIAMLAMIGYGVFGCIFPAFLMLTDIKYVISGPAKIHNAFYVFGHICLLIASMCMTGTAFEHLDYMRGAIFAIINLIGIFAYMIYNMSDRMECRDTVIGLEGVWEFVFHILAYFPIGYATVQFMIF